MSALLKRVLPRTLRGQLILGIVLVHAVIMTVFVYDLVHRQSRFLHRQTEDHALSLSRAMAAAGTQWVLASDLVGLDELVHGMAGYPDLRYAMIVAPDGRVLAHSQDGVVGRYLADPVSLRLLTAVPSPRVLVNTDEVVDVAAPVLLQGEPIGWARVALGQESQASNLAQVVREGVIYTLVAIVLGGLFGALMARRMTRRLNVLGEVAEAVRAGRHDLRADLSGADEIGQVANGVDRMIDQMVENERQIQHSQEALRSSQLLLDSIIEHIPNMVFLKRASDLRFVLLNQAAEDLLGITRQAMLGKNDYDFFPAEQADFFTAKDREVLEQREVIDIAEENIVSQTHGQRILHTKKLGLRNEHGQPEYLLGISEDITEQKRAETELARYREHLEALVAERTAALAESELSYRTVADFTNDWETWLGEDGRYRYISPSCERITGYAAEAFMADPDLMLRIMVGEDVERIGGHFHGDIGDRPPTILEFRIRRKDGEVIWIEHACRPVHGPDGAFLGRRASNRDITEHKRLAFDLARARDDAEAANRAKSQFLANMSHELRTPLNAILGFAQLMERDPALSAEQKHGLATINRSGHHLLDLINDVLDISRIETGRTAVRMAPFDLDDTLRAIEEMTRVRSQGKGLGFVLDRVGPLPRHVNGDAPRLRQVLLNLLTNAVKYTDRGEVRLTVTGAGDGRMRFEVSDSGPGIAPEEQERVFQAFYQTAAGVAKGEGAGLGLAISREYTRLMGGELRLESQLGQGSRFYFELPLPEADPLDASAALPHRVVRLHPDQAPVTVLVVEDNEDNRELLTRLLERVGYRTLVAQDGQEAIARFQDNHPEFIWMDMRMPVMDGYQATRRIRDLPGGGAVKIAALTASAFMENREDILAAGCDEMVAKPLDESQIFETMARLLGVRYDYELDRGEVRPAVTPSALPVLPAGLLAGLRGAAVALDMEAARALIEQIGAIDSQAAATLRGLLDEFRIDDILRLLADQSKRPAA